MYTPCLCIYTQCVCVYLRTIHVCTVMYSPTCAVRGVGSGRAGVSLFLHVCMGGLARTHCPAYDLINGLASIYLD